MPRAASAAMSQGLNGAFRLASPDGLRPAGAGLSSEERVIHTWLPPAGPATVGPEADREGEGGEGKSGDDGFTGWAFRGTSMRGPADHAADRRS
jgi:hypothetical protein